jgi:hypothetical protein
MRAHNLTVADVRRVLAVGTTTHLDARGNRHRVGVSRGRVVRLVLAANRVPTHVVTLWDEGEA